MRTRLAAVAALASLAGLAAAPARAADRWPTDPWVCIGVYGALADQAQGLADWAPALGRSNLTKIDWAARKAAILGKDQTGIYASSASVYEYAFKSNFLRDRVDGTAKDTADQLELSQKCDAANGFSPAFAMPGS